MIKVVHADLETRSRVDLPSVGSFRYAVDPSTEILMCAVSGDELDAPVHLWVNPKYETPDLMSDDEALELLRQADLVYGHNASGFEVPMFWGCSNPVMGVRIRLEQWRCTAAMARKAGLPWSLEKCGEALSLPIQKDKEGKRLIKLFSIPQENGEFARPQDHPDDWYKFGQYCKQDVRTEKGIHRALKAFELTGSSLETFQFDLRMNLRGIPVNRRALENANAIIDSVQSEVTKEFQTLTGLNPTQREKVRELVGLPNMQAETVQDAITLISAAGKTAESIPALAHVPENAKRTLHILELYSKLSYAAVKKIPAMLDWACPDDRMRGVFKYYGAGTGRWSSGGPQLQNAKKPTGDMKGITDAAYRYLCNGATPEGLDLLFGDPLEVIASSVRHFVHKPGEEMLDGDYNAIEGRIACWIAGQKDILEDWRAGKDLYKRAAAFVEDIEEKQVSADSRAFGKVLELAGQYGLGVDGFMRTCENWGVECDAEKARRGIYEYYRPTHSKIVSRWYFLDDCMRDAITVPGTRCGPVVVKPLAGMLYMLLTLPSGRSLAYPQPEINRREPTAEEREEMKLGKVYPDKRFMEITYWGQLFQSTQWGRVKLHGSKMLENEVQAIAADFMAHGAITAEKRGMAPFALIHDQALALREKGKTAEDFAAALGALPSWAPNFPLRVEAKVCNWYAK